MYFLCFHTSSALRAEICRKFFEYEGAIFEKQTRVCNTCCFLICSWTFTSLNFVLLPLCAFACAAWAETEYLLRGLCRRTQGGASGPAVQVCCESARRQYYAILMKMTILFKGNWSCMVTKSKKHLLGLPGKYWIFCDGNIAAILSSRSQLPALCYHITHVTTCNCLTKRLADA